MDSRTYWEKRAKENELRVFQYAGKRAQLVTRWFSQAQKEMQQRIDVFYRQYAKDGRISLREAKHAIADRRTISLTLEEARRLGSLYPDDAEITRLLRKQYIQRAVSREELLCMQLQLLAGELYGRYAAETTRSLTEIFEESYYRTLYGFQKFTGYGTHFNRLNTHQIEAAVNTAWSGKNYSERIWGGQRGALARNLDRIITTGVIQGRPQGEMAAQLRKAMDISAYNARRLIRTECTAVAGKANLAGYQENGTGQFEFVATLDNRTSARCRGMDGKHFYVKDGKIGVNIPPLHPFCRSTTVPYVPDARFDLDDTRAARSGTGETYSVPGGMAYKEWHRKYVGTSPDELLSERKVQNGYADAAQFERYTKALGKDAPKSLDGFQRIKYTEPKSWDVLKRTYRQSSNHKQVQKGGRASGVNDNSDSSAPQVIGKLSYFSEETALEALNNFKPGLEDSPIEIDYTATKDGRIWKTTGTDGSVHPEKIETEAGVSLAGSYSLHSHPKATTNFSLSADDIGFLFEYRVEYSEAVDWKYTYAIRRTKHTPENISHDDVLYLFDQIHKRYTYKKAWNGKLNIDEDGYHNTMKILARYLKLQYRREKR